MPNVRVEARCNRSVKVDKEQVIQKLWESSNHGTQREDVEAAYEAGVAAERERCAAEIHRLQDLLRWAYSKLHARTFSSAEDALKLDELKLLLEHGL